MQNIAIIILAAGSSSRLGQPKQLLIYQSQSLLQRIISNVASVPNVMSAIVLGAGKEIIEKEIAGTGIKIVLNENWQQGLASSIKAGLTAMMETNPALEGCLFVVCDQPYITTQLLREIISVHKQSGKGIVAAAYADTVGTPVFFSKKYFNELMLLRNEEGAKKVIQQHLYDLASVPFLKGEVDIDTQEDYKKLTDAD